MGLTQEALQPFYDGEGVMTFDEWLAEYPYEVDICIKSDMRQAWEAGYHQGRLYEGAWKTARLMDNELFGHLKAAQEKE